MSETGLNIRYPGWIGMDRLLDSGGASAGRYLNERSHIPAQGRVFDVRAMIGVFCATPRTGWRPFRICGK